MEQHHMSQTVTRIDDEPRGAVVQTGGGASFTTISLMTLVGLVIIAIVVLVILHVTVGVA